MKQPLQLAWLLLLLAAVSRAQDDDDRPQAALAPDSAGALALTQSQQQAVGIRIDHPLPMTSPQPVDAFGSVLDPVALVTDAGRVDSTRAAADAAAADLARLDSLYRNSADASLKALQAARALASEADAQAQAAASSFRLQWGPLAELEPAARRELIDALVAGRRLLLRADVPGRELLGSLVPRALVIVDGVSITAHVLGPMPRTDAQSQASGWLLQIERGPPGFGPGARALVRLQAAAVGGVLVPAAALLYGDHGAYVYRQVGDSDSNGGSNGGSDGGSAQARYAAAPVTLLVRVGDGWLVRGLGRTDRIVVQGAGVLWSLEGISNFSAAEQEHD